MSQFEDRRKSDILEDGSQWVQSHDAQRINCSAALAVADLVRSTLGPRGFDKLLVAGSGTVVDETDIPDTNAILCTNDGMSILDKANVNHPAAETLVEVAQAQNGVVSDGTTTAVIVAGELLRNAGDLLDRDAHPTEIIRGYRRAAELAGDTIDDISHSGEYLKQVAETCLAGTILDGDREELAALIAEAVRRASVDGTEGDTEVEGWRLRVVSPKGGGDWEPQIAGSCVLEREAVDSRMPAPVDGSILLVESPLALTDTEAIVEKSVEGWSGYENLVTREDEHARSRIELLREVDPDVVFCGESVDDPTATRLAREGILAFERVPEADLVRLEELLGVEAVSDPADIEQSDLATGSVRHEPAMNGYWIEPDEERSSVLTLVVPEPAVSDLYDNVPKRIVEDTIDVVTGVAEGGRVAPGGGATEMEIAKRLGNASTGLDGREQLAFEAFADAVEVVPRQLAETAGMKPTDTLIELRNAHEAGSSRTCIDVRENALVDAFDAGILDSATAKRQSIDSAAGAVNRVLKIDTIISEGDGTDDSDDGSGSTDAN